MTAVIRKPRGTKPKEPKFVVPTTIPEAKKIVEQEVKQLLATKYTPEKIRSFIETYIQNTITDLIHVSLGFSKDRWGNTKWEVDHCNGRAGESLVGRKVADMAAETVNKAVEKAISSGKFTVTEAHIAALNKCFTEHVTGYKGRQVMEQLAEEKLNRFRQTLTGEIFKG